MKTTRLLASRRRFLGCGIAAVAVSSTNSFSATSSPEGFVAVMDYLPSWKHAAFHLAKVKGWYRDAGLDVQIEDGSGSTITIAQTSAGKCDVGLANLSAMAVANSKGSNVVGVGSVIKRNDVGMLIDRKISITEPKQLAVKNAKIFFEATSYRSLFKPFFKNMGVEIEGVSLIPMSSASAIGTYLAGQGDALITTVPYVLPVVEKRRPSDTLMQADYGLPLPSHGIVANRNTMMQRGDALRRFLAVTERGWQQVWSGNAREAIDALVDQRPHAKLDVALELARVDAYRPYALVKGTTDYSLRMPPQDWEIATRIMEDAGIIPADSNASAFFTNEFLKTA